MSETPLVSIALTTYNGEKYLAEQLDSILQQTYTNIEVIITDDASTDNTIRILKAYAAKDKRVSYYINEKNIGFNNNFIKAMGFCKGAFIAISDQDDIWHVEKISTMLAAYDGQAMLIHCNSVKFSGVANLALFTTTHLGKRFSGTNGSSLALINTIEGHAVILKKELLALIQPIPSNIYYDWWMGIIAADNGGVQWVNKTLVLRRIHESNTFEKLEQFKISVREKHLNHLVAFSTCHKLRATTKQFATSTIEALHQKPVLLKLTSYLYKHAHSIFYYKKRNGNTLSNVKNAYKLAKKLSK